MNGDRFDASINWTCIRAGHYETDDGMVRIERQGRGWKVTGIGIPNQVFPTFKSAAAHVAAVICTRQRVLGNPRRARQ